MRQIGVRDEARMVGGLGHCGQELCCKRLGGEFCPVSIRMAKEQDLSLNPQKISGVCGRLMCCLRYEFDAYKDFKGRAPKHNGTVQTPDGPAKVVDLDVPREDGVAEAGRREGGEGAAGRPGDRKAMHVRPNRSRRRGVGARHRARRPWPWRASRRFLTSQFTGTDKLAQAGQACGARGQRRAGSGRRKDAGRLC